MIIVGLLVCYVCTYSDITNKLYNTSKTISDNLTFLTPDEPDEKNSGSDKLSKKLDPSILTSLHFTYRIRYKLTCLLLIMTLLSLGPDWMPACLITIAIICLNRQLISKYESYTTVAVLLEYCLIESLFYTTHHFENYYQLHFLDLYSLYGKMSGIFLNTFSPTIIWHGVTYLSYNLQIMPEANMRYPDFRKSGRVYLYMKM